MSSGINVFLGELGRRPVAITTFAPVAGRVVGTVERLEEDVIVLRRQANDSLVCIAKAAVAIIEAEITMNP